MNLEVLFQDEHFVAVTKPSGLLVHPYWRETKERKCLMKDLKMQIGKWLYPVHRLDRPVSGVVLFGLEKEATRRIQTQWHMDSTKKTYLALAKNVHTCARRFDFPLNNENKVPQEAITLAEPLETFEDSTLMKVEIKTGRKHQIRRHFSHRMSHIIGDRMYGKKPVNDHYLDHFGLERIFLHAHQLAFEHPFTGKKLEITSPLPDDLSHALEKMRRSPNG